MGFLSSIFGGKKKSSTPTFDYQPYSGPTPPGIDYDGVKYLRPTQDLTQKIIGERAQGIGVGYDPRRTELLTNLARNQNQMSLEDSLHSANGQLASSGLSGNPRAYEALAGRARRDSARSLDNNLSQIAISDLERGNQERDANTARLQRLNETNFGQENTRADFGLNQYNQEQANRINAAEFNRGTQQYGQNRQDELLSTLGQYGGMALGAYFGGPTGAAIGGQVGSQVFNGNQPGAGIAQPGISGIGQNYDPYTGRKTGYRNLVR